MSDFYIEFEIASDEAFGKLTNVSAALVAAKANDEWEDESFWLAFFDDDARKTFWWPTPAELKDWERRWFSTPVEKRWNDPSLKTSWDFSSLIDAFRNGEYALLGCRQVSESRGRFEFDPHAFPYGGTECMRVLVESFGHRVVDVRE